MNKLNVFRWIDKYGWAFYFTTIEQKKYSVHNVFYYDWADTLKNFDNLHCDIFYIPSPKMCGDKVNETIKKIKNHPNFKNTKIIGGYSGLLDKKYAYADLILPIAINDYPKIRNESEFPVAFLPESVDTQIFAPSNEKHDFVVGWAGKNQPDKRAHLLDNLILPIKKQCNHGKEYFKDGRSQQPMIDFYHSISCLILTSSHECMPRVVLEAMSCGLPVIATNVGSIPWLLHKDWIVPAYPEEEVIREINKRIRLLWDNVSIREEVGKMNRKWIEEFFSCHTTQPLWDEVYGYLNQNNFKDIYRDSNIYLNKLNDKIKERNKISYNFSPKKTKLHILKVIDSFGWAYDFLSKEQIKFSQHQLETNIISEVKRLPHAYNYDIVYFSSPNMSETRDVTQQLKLQNTKIIGAYAGENYETYREKDIDLFVSISYPFMEKIKSMYPYNKVVFMPEGIDDTYFIPNNNHNHSFVVGWAGRKAPVKRCHLLNQLNYLVKKQSKHSEENLSKDSSQTEMLNFYHSIDVLILTSSSECMPRVVLEAMACGLPVISTDVGSLRMLLEEEWLIPPENEEKVVHIMNQKLELLEKNPKLRKKVGERNRKYIEEHFSWKKIMPLWDSTFTALYNNNYREIEQISQQFIRKLNLKNLDNKKEETIIPSAIDVKLKSETSIPNNNPRLSKEKIEIIKSLIFAKIDFWFLKNSCLECVTKGELISDLIQIGVKNETVRNEIIKLTEKSQIKVEIFIEPNRKTKPYGICNLPTQVPLPVVDYLEKYCRKKWKEIIGG